MRYLAVEIGFKPFIVWIGTNLPLGSLVLNEEDVPEPLFNVCPLKIVDGELVERTELEMEAFEEEYLAKLVLKTDERKIDSLASLTFTYAGKDYPMNETARLYYHAIDKYRFGTHKAVRSLTGVESIAVGDINAFLEEYYKTIAGTLEPTI